jgi:hypothetical protein
MSNVKIKKASIKDDLFLNVEYVEELQGHSKKDTKLSCTVPVHDDLKDAFGVLHKHLAILCDEVTTPTKAKYEGLECIEFTVKGFSIGGNDENEGVTITGAKEGKYGLVNLNTPFTKWTSTDYPYAAELAADIETAVYEVNEYLFNGKRAPERQLEMEFEGMGEDEKFAEEAK